MLSAQSCSTEGRPPRPGGCPCGEERARARRRIAVAACALAVLPGLVFPLAQARADALIWEGNDQSVLLAPQDDESAPPNDHPVSLEPRAVEKMLSDLRFRYADQEPDAPPVAVFNSEQVEILGQALVTGLERATPSQDITFSVIGAHRLSPGAFARRNRLTAGRVFFRDGELNLILGEIQSPYRKKNIYGRIEQDFHPRQYGNRAEPREQESLLVGSTLASLHGNPGEDARRDWVVFDPDMASRDPASESRSADAAGSADSAPAASPAAAPAGAGSATASGTRDAASRRPEDAGRAGIEQRLETLKRLRDKELISEEAYRQKVDEILEDL